eukprot:gene1440-836_t
MSMMSASTSSRGSTTGLLQSVLLQKDQLINAQENLIHENSSLLKQKDELLQQKDELLKQKDELLQQLVQERIEMADHMTNLDSHVQDVRRLSRGETPDRWRSDHPQRSLGSSDPRSSSSTAPQTEVPPSSSQHSQGHPMLNPPAYSNQVPHQFHSSLPPLQNRPPAQSGPTHQAGLPPGGLPNIDGRSPSRPFTTPPPHEMNLRFSSVSAPPDPASSGPAQQDTTASHSITSSAPPIERSSGRHPAERVDRVGTAEFEVEQRPTSTAAVSAPADQEADGVVRETTQAPARRLPSPPGAMQDSPLSRPSRAHRASFAVEADGSVRTFSGKETPRSYPTASILSPSPRRSPTAQTATESLYQLLLFGDRSTPRDGACSAASTASLPRAAIAQLVADGANVNFRAPDADFPLLALLVWRCKVRLLRLCLRSPNPIDFTAVDRSGLTPLHWIPSPASKTADQVATILNLFIDRLERCDGDMVNWGQKSCNGMECISYAACYRHLAVWWSVVMRRRVAYYQVDGGRRLRITCPVWRADWDRVPASDRSRFELGGAASTYHISYFIATAFHSSIFFSFSFLYQAHRRKKCSTFIFVAGGGLCLTSSRSQTFFFPYFLAHYKRTPPGIIKTNTLLNRDAHDTFVKYEYCFTFSFRSNRIPLFFFPKSPPPITEHKSSRMTSQSPKVRRDMELLERHVEEESSRKKERGQKILRGRFAVSHDPTTALLTLCQEWEWDPDPGLVAQCVSQDADVFFSEPDAQWPVIHWLALNGRVAAVEACLATKRPLDFTLKNAAESTLLHCMVYDKLADDESVGLLAALVRRLQHHRETDLVDWLQEDYDKHHFLAKAAQNQLLSVAAPIVIQGIGLAEILRSHNVHKSPNQYVSIIPLDEVWQWDWNALSPELRAAFELESYATVIDNPKPTAKLFKLSNQPLPSVHDVRQCVVDGGDVMFRVRDSLPQHHRHEDAPLLSKLLWKRFHPLSPLAAAEAAAEASGEQNHVLELIEACMQSPNPIRFTEADEYGNTFLHCLTNASLVWAFYYDEEQEREMHRKNPGGGPFIADPAITRRKVLVLVEAILNQIVQRVERSPSDELNWEQTTQHGHHALSYAAEAGLLSTWVRVLRQRHVPYFAQAGPQRPIALTKRIQKADWEALSQEDQAKFRTGEPKSLNTTKVTTSTQVATARKEENGGEPAPLANRTASRECNSFPFIPNSSNKQFRREDNLHGRVKNVWKDTEERERCDDESGAAGALISCLFPPWGLRTTQRAEYSSAAFKEWPACPLLLEVHWRAHVVVWFIMNKPNVITTAHIYYFIYYILFISNSFSSTRTPTIYVYHFCTLMVEDGDDTNKKSKKKGKMLNDMHPQHQQQKKEENMNNNNNNNNKTTGDSWRKDEKEVKVFAFVHLVLPSFAVHRRACGRMVPSLSIFAFNSIRLSTHTHTNTDPHRSTDGTLLE